MKSGKGSRSAEGVTLARAIESRRPRHIRVCHDPVAEHFLTGMSRLLVNERIRNLLIAVKPMPVRAGIAGYVPLRTRFIDDRLKACLNDGLDQVVILGAGYDSRALRFEELKTGMKVFEVDRPQTQAVKFSRLRKVYGSIPGHVTYVPIDFDRDDLQEKLLRHGYDSEGKTLFIWEGVTYYLDSEAVDQTLSFIAGRSKPGSSVIFDYLTLDVVKRESTQPLAQEFMDFVEGIGEPIRFGMDPGYLETFLSDRGLSPIKAVSVEECMRAYHTAAHRVTPVLRFFHIAHAAVLPR